MLRKMPPTTLYLVRHGATEANLARPPLLQGRRLDLPLTPFGLAQAQVTRGTFAGVALADCFTSPLRRAVDTAAIIAGPHGLTPRLVDALTECDGGQWEGLSWEAIHERWPVEYQRFHVDPWSNGYLGGESLRDVHARSAPVLDALLAGHEGQSILVVSHHVVLRAYLAGLLGLPPAQARRVTLDNASVSIVIRDGGVTRVERINDVGHLAGSASKQRLSATAE
jgi:broad specificity phosphatase PhoE